MMDQATLDRVCAAVVTVKSGEKVGSGWVVTGQLVVTNAHCVGYGPQVEVRFAEGTRVTARVVSYDAKHDIACLEVPGLPGGVTPLKMAGGALLAQPVAAIGAPHGLRSSVSVGVVSQPERLINGVAWVQTDAALNPGNSGGPLVDVAGNVVGLNSFVRRAADGIGFALPSRQIHAHVATLLKRRSTDPSAGPEYRCVRCESPVVPMLDAECLSCGELIRFHEVTWNDETHAALGLAVHRMFEAMGIRTNMVLVAPWLWNVHVDPAGLVLRVGIVGKNLEAEVHLGILPVDQFEPFYRFLLTANDGALGGPCLGLRQDTVAIRFAERTEFMEPRLAATRLTHLMQVAAAMQQLLTQEFGMRPIPEDQA